VSHPAGLPDLFLDRSLGRVKVPALLRAAGLRLVTLAEQYGMPADEAVSDEDWLALAGGRGWAVFMKDTRIRYNAAERAALVRHGVRAFCLSSQSIDANGMAACFLGNLGAITAACRDPGPFVYRDRVTRLTVGP
jgi:PIN like domain